MVLVDTSVWVDHFRKSNPHLSELLFNGHVACHHLVIGELSCGHLKNRKEILSLLNAMPKSQSVDDDEVLYFIEEQKLIGLGFGIVDLHLLSSTILTGISLWIYDKSLRKAAETVNRSYRLS